MKKHLTTILNFAMMMFVAFTASFTLTSCGEEVVIDDNPSGKTVFSASPVNIGGEDETRTTLDATRIYRWSYGDNIWINVNGTWLKSSDIELSPDQRSANFYYDRLLTASSYQVIYTGQDSPSPLKLTIQKAYTTESNGYNTIGSSGDCGVGTATRNSDGTYSFQLQHKASYLGVAPLLQSYLNKIYRWTKIEITEADGKALAGAFNFSHANGIDTTDVTSPSKTITLTSVGQNKAFFQNYSSNIIYNYLVIPPTHRKLWVKYYFVDDANPSDTMTITKALKSRKFIENNVTQLKHGITPDFYNWDALKTRTYDAVANNNCYNTAGDFKQATRSCATMPNPNELAWYIANGDPRWDDKTEWTMAGDTTKYKGGVWVKKRANITGFSSTASPDGIDRRTTYAAMLNNSAIYRNSGKPTTNVGQYFFLPALGWYGGVNLQNSGITGRYWSSYTVPSNYDGSYTDGLPRAYILDFTSNSIRVGVVRRSFGCIAGNGADWFK